MLALILKKLLIIYVLLFCAIMIVRRLFAGKAARSASFLSDVIVVRGKVAMTVDGSRAYPALIAEDGVEYELTGNCLEEIEKRSQQVVSLKGKIRKEADGRGASVVFYIMEILED